MAGDFENLRRQAKRLRRCGIFTQGESLVNRSKVKENIVRVGSEDAWLATLAGFRRLVSLADGRTIEASKYYDEE
jgi:ABC-type phosphate/phosphonate transport system ATPase subunit